MRRVWGVLLAMVLSGFDLPMPAMAFDAAEVFQQGTWILSFEGGGGHQDNIDRHSIHTGFELWSVGARVGRLPLPPRGRGVLRGALEIGLEPIYQRYTGPVSAFFAGLGLVGRYHFLALDRVVPYLELVGAVGGTDLRAREIDSPFTFLVAGGAGLSVFVSERMAVYAGYRLVHVSNGNTDEPNRGFEAHTGLAGVSFYLR